MGIAYKADRSLDCTISVWDGRITAEDVRQHLGCLASDSEWPAGRLHLTDLRSITTATVPDPELLDLLYEGTNLAETLKVAVVVRAEPPFRSDLRYETATESLGAATFSDLALACAYLGLDEGAAGETIAELRHQLQVDAAKHS